MNTLSIASAVVQFVDFTSKLVSKGNEYHKSANGALVEHNELRAVSNNLVVLSTGLDDALASFQLEKKPSREEQALKNVVEDCRRAASEFIEVLDTFKVSGGHQRWKSFRQAFKTIWNKDQIAEMLGKLNLARDQLVIHLLVSIR